MPQLLLALLIAAPLVVLAASSSSAPISWDGFRELLPVLFIALLGGLVAFINKVRSGDTRPFNVAEFAGEMIISGFSGVLAFWICSGFDINSWLTAAIVGISGHMGSRGIFMFEKWAEAKLNELGLTKPK
jgi:hypothetical protein